MIEKVQKLEQRRLRWVVPFAAAAIAGAAMTVSSQGDGAAYVGQSVPVELEWTCSNGIFWPPNGIESVGRTWWAGDDPRPAGNIAPTIGPAGNRRVSGSLTFENADHATFTSDNGGGTLAMTLTTPGQFFLAGCRIGF